MIMMIDFWLYGIVKQFIMILNVFIIRYSKIYLHIYIFTIFNISQVQYLLTTRSTYKFYHSVRLKITIILQRMFKYTSGKLDSTTVYVQYMKLNKDTM